MSYSLELPDNSCIIPCSGKLRLEREYSTLDEEIGLEQLIIGHGNYKRTEKGIHYAY